MNAPRVSVDQTVVWSVEQTTNRYVVLLITLNKLTFFSHRYNKYNNCKEMCCERAEWIRLTKHSFKWRTLLNTLMKLSGAIRDIENLD